MKLKVLASGSDGNCYILEDNNGEKLILDLGIGEKEFKIGNNFLLTNIKGALVTHSHQDHSSLMNRVRQMGIKVVAPWEQGYIDQTWKLGDYQISAFFLRDNDGYPTHSNSDGTPCEVCGYHIYHPEMGNLLYITDTYMVRYKFKNISHLLFGTNYDEELVNEDDDARLTHVYSGHSSIQYLTNVFLKNNVNADELQNLIMCHLSGVNANGGHFIEEASKIVSKGICVAYKGITVVLSQQTKESEVF